MFNEHIFFTTEIIQLFSIDLAIRVIASFLRRNCDVDMKIEQRRIKQLVVKAQLATVRL